MNNPIVLIALVLITSGIAVAYVWHARRQEARASQILKKSIERGMDEPVSLHPFIDPNICIGSGACVMACPETDVLGLIGNRGVLINPSHCIGHGACAAACPVDAITLVFGTEKRGVDIPHVSSTFETNVPGIYIAGELGGMGLIHNAIVQGRQAAESIAKSLSGKAPDPVHDLIIVGAGPAGIAASLRAKELGLHFITVDQEDLGGTILTYPRRKLVMTRPVELPIFGSIKATEVEKEALLRIFEQVFTSTKLSVRGGEKVEEIQRVNGHFRVVTTRGEHEARRVLLAIGRRGSPRKLEVPGEKSAKVAYRLLEPEKIHHAKVLVVGGGDSAVEAALALAEQPGNTVHVSYRREGFFRLKEGNRARVDGAIQQGRIAVLFESSVTRIEPEKVHLRQGSRDIALDNDRVFVLIGGELPSDFLKKAGIEVERKFGER